MLVNTDQYPFARRSGPVNRVGLQMTDQLVIDPLRSPAQRQSAQGGQVPFREIILDGAAGSAGG